MEAVLLLQHSDHVPVFRWYSANAEFSQSPLSTALQCSFTRFPGHHLSSLHKWLGNQHMGFGTPLLTSLQWGHGLLVWLVAVWVWYSGGRTPSTPAEWGPTALPLIDIGKGDLLWIIWPMLQDALGCWLRSHNADSRMMCTSRIAQALVWRRW